MITAVAHTEQRQSTYAWLFMLESEIVWNKSLRKKLSNKAKEAADLLSHDKE